MKIRDIERAINAVNNAKKRLDKMNEKYPKMYKNDLEEIGKSVIAHWYGTYDPIYYDRKMDLRNAWRVNLNGLDYSVDFDASLMEFNHRVSNEYIFENSFMHGYHGGAINGDGHPNPGIPYWRTPFPELTYWGSPAVRSFSPYSRMVFEMKRRIKEIDNQKQNEFDSVIAKVQRAIDKLA